MLGIIVNELTAEFVGVVVIAKSFMFHYQIIYSSQFHFLFFRPQSSSLPQSVVTAAAEAVPAAKRAAAAY